MDKITVFGSFAVDLMGRSEHIPVVGETVKGHLFKMGPGGKGSNQAVAAKRAGADVTIITKVGRDNFAQVALDSFRNEKMDTDFIFIDDEGNATGAALIMVEERSAHNSIVVLPGACEKIKPSEIDFAAQRIKDSKYLLTQLETNLDATIYAIDIAYKNGVKVILNPAPAIAFPDSIYSKIYCITPNEVEAGLLANTDTSTMEGIKKAVEYFHTMGVPVVIITLGSKGAYISADGIESLIENIKVDVVDTTGAGDAFNGGLATGLAEGKDIAQAAKFANVVAGLSVTKIGTASAMPTRKEIDDYISKK